MNRLQPVELALDNRHSAAGTNPDRWQISDLQVPFHRLFIPLHYEKNYAYPLLVWLHGPTGNESEINQVMPHISFRNYVGISLRGVVTDQVVDHRGESTFTWDQDPCSIECAVEDVLQCVSLAKGRFNIAPDRVFLVGHDVGGTMALRLALKIPEHFAGVVSIGGKMPKSNTPLAGIGKSRCMPIMIAQGRDSDVYSTDEVCEDLRLLHAAGMRVTLRQYPCEHEVTTRMLSDVNVWMMEQVSGVPYDSGDCADPTHMRLEDYN